MPYADVAFVIKIASFLRERQKEDEEKFSSQRALAEQLGGSTNEAQVREIHQVRIVIMEEG